MRSQNSRHVKIIKNGGSMIVKLHNAEGGRTLAAVIDTNLLGTVHEEGNHKLNFTEPFYEGIERTPSEVGDIMRNADFLNIAGKETITLALEEEVITEQDVRMIDGVPYAVVVLVQE
mgnify:CR=1 FL=1